MVAWHFERRHRHEAVMLRNQAIGRIGDPDMPRLGIEYDAAGGEEVRSPDVVDRAMPPNQPGLDLAGYDAGADV